MNLGIWYEEVLFRPRGNIRIYKEWQLFVGLIVSHLEISKKQQAN